jgi:hypothetical protein
MKITKEKTMSVLKIGYGEGRAGAFFDLLSGSFLIAGPSSVSDLVKHPAFIRRYESRSGLSGVLAFTNCGLIEKVDTYRPQHGEYPLMLDPKFPILPVDRNELQFGYPVILSVDGELIDDDYVVTVNSLETSDLNSWMELSELEVQSRELSMVVRNLYGDEKTLRIRVNHHSGDLDNRNFYAAVNVAANWCKQGTFVFQRPSKEFAGKEHPIFASLWRDQFGMWYTRNQFGLYVNVGTDDPIRIWIASGQRPEWAETSVYPMFINGVWGRMTLGSVMFYDEEGKFIGSHLFRDIQDRMFFLKSPEKYLNIEPVN